SITATVAAAEQNGSWDPALVRTKAVRGQDGWQLSGFKVFVPAAERADVYLVIARSVAGPSLFAVERSAPGSRALPLDVIDEPCPLHRLEFANTPAKLVSAEGSGGRLMMTVIDLATTALAGEQVGVIDKAISLVSAGTPTETEFAEMTVNHVAAEALWR